jgi:hypothetical protein
LAGWHKDAAARGYSFLITKSLWAADSAPHTSPLRPASCHTLAKAVIAVTDRDPRCKMITLDPNTAEAKPELLRTVRDSHEGKAGLYGAVLVKGTVRPGDEIRLLDH